MATAHHTIQSVSRLTGLSTHVIRVWEKRYATVTPQRTATNRRRYSAGDIERLKLLRAATELGNSISSVAGLELAELRAISQAITPPAVHQPVTEATPNPDRFLPECLAAVRKLDAYRLEELLREASVTLGSRGLLQKVVSPLARELGARWYAGEITAAHEHFASSIIRVFLGAAIKPFPLAHSAPKLVAATPAGQVHELGAVIVAAAAASQGWSVTYLGASLPAVEIAGAAIQNQARVVALSLVYPPDDPGLPGELERLRSLLPPGVKILAGGRAAPAYRETLLKIGATECADVDDFCTVVETARASPAPTALILA